jgi:hypothetical protein
MAFQDAVVDYSIPPRERVQLFHHVSRDRAYQYYHSHVLTHATVIAEAHKLMEDQFCFAASQHSTKTLLDVLDISLISMEKKLSKKESLNHIYEEIDRLSSQCPPEFRSDANRVEFLKKAVRDEQWALSTQESHMTTFMNFTTLHTRLSSAIGLHEKLATRNTPARATPHCACCPDLLRRTIRSDYYSSALKLSYASTVTEQQQNQNPR